MKTYIHYGCKKYIPEIFTEITNRGIWSKPLGGLWASNIDSEYGWIDFCEHEEFHLDTYNLENSFEFKLSEDAKVLHLYSVEDVEVLPYISKEEGTETMMGTIYLDFEAIKQEYDAIELHLSSDYSLYYALYGWDCDCILIMNKDIIIPLE